MHNIDTGEIVIKSLYEKYVYIYPAYFQPYTDLICILYKLDVHAIINALNLHINHL